MIYEVLDNRYTAFLENVRTYFEDATRSLHKARNEIKVISFLKEDIVVKSFKIPHLINKFAYTFLRDSKAKKSYLNSLKIIDFVPKPIGYMEFFKFGLLYDSYFLSEEFNYDFTIREVLLDHNFTDRENIFKAFARFTYALHEADIEHLDYSPGNILIKVISGNYVFKIVDINRMEFRSLNHTERLENFSKLWAKDEDLTIIVKFYSIYIDLDERTALHIALKASQKHKDKKNFKKRLKGIKVVD